MSFTDEVVQTIAAELVHCEDNATVVSPLTERYPDITVQTAYEIQMAAIRIREQRGEKIVGKKIGLTSEKIREQIGVHEPDYGMLMNTAMMMDNDIIRLSQLIAPRGEAEIAFVLKEDLAGPNITIADVYRATEGVIPAFELVDSRMKDWKIKLPDTVADNASCARVVLGTKMTKLSDVDLRHVGLVLRRNGRIIDTAAGAAVMGHPAHAVAWLANKLYQYGISLKKGEIIISGSLTPVFDIAVGDHVEASFGELGTVSLRVAE